MKRSEKSMLAFAIIVGLCGGCATLYKSSQVRIYEPGNVTIKNVIKQRNQSIRIEYQPLSETLYYSPGVVINTRKREISLKIIRAPTEDAPVVVMTSTEELQKPQRAGLSEIIEVRNPSDKPIYLLDAQGQRTLIYEGQASPN